jgi:NAD-dependent dihydropyrimidine dehydrogenase PreA subunit
MPSGSYLGIPREMIPWAPVIDNDTCIGCGKCLDTCANGVYVLNEGAGKMEVAVPGNCVVLCDKCAGFCDQDAIRFPDKEETKRLIGKLLREGAGQREKKSDVT